MTSDRRRYLIAETAIGTVMNIVMSLVAIFLASGGRIGPPTAVGIVLQTFMVAFMSVFVATLLTRLRRRRGRLAAGAHAVPGVGRLVPRNMVARALLAGTLCLLVMAPALAVMLPPVLAAPPGQVATGVATAAYALILSLLFTPPALVLALDDPAA